MSSCRGRGDACKDIRDWSRSLRLIRDSTEGNRIFVSLEGKIVNCFFLLFCSRKNISQQNAKRENSPCIDFSIKIKTIFRTNKTLQFISRIFEEEEEKGCRQCYFPRSKQVVRQYQKVVLHSRKKQKWINVPCAPSISAASQSYAHPRVEIPEWTSAVCNIPLPRILKTSCVSPALF